MSRRKKKASVNPLIIGGGVALVIALLAAVFLMGNQGGTTATSSLITPQQYTAEFQNDPNHILIDVRTPQEFESGHIPGAINIPVDQVGSRLAEIPADQEVVVYCRSGNRSATAARELAANGYEVYDLGGIIDWEAAGLPVD